MNIYGNFLPAKVKPSIEQTYLKLNGKQTSFAPMSVYEVTKSSSDGKVQTGDIIAFTPEGKSLVCMGWAHPVAEEDYTDAMLDFEYKPASEYYQLREVKQDEWHIYTVTTHSFLSDSL